MAHECHVYKCRQVTPRGHLMCGSHWSMVPDELKRLVVEAYKPGQEQGTIRPSARWHAAARAACSYVETLERFNEHG